MIKSFFLIFASIACLSITSHALAQNITTLSPHISLKKEWPEINALIAKDSRNIIINVWASWCLPCVKELPTLQKLNPDTWQLITVNIDANLSDAHSFLKRNNLQDLIPKMYHDPSLSLMRAFKIKGIPSSLVASPDGNIHSLIQGDISHNPIKILNQTLVDS
jgi:thiol-disulfide isomerase/thioredoxin